MKKITTLALLLSSLTAVAQTFNSPESVEYDTQNSRWIVGQNGSGQIHIYSPASSTLSSFASNIPSGPHGIEVLGDTVYACDGAYIKGFLLSNGTQVFNLNLGASFLNGLTSDGGHFLFTTDFTAKKIFRVNTLAGTFNQMASTTYTPNGIYYDGANNRCVFVNWGSTARVQAMSLSDSTISTLYTTSTSNIDGITRDNAGYWYISTWGGNALRMFDPAFSAAPTSVMTGLSSPADIDINAAGDSIGIPNSGASNNVVFYTGITTGMKPLDFGMLPMTCTPNPAADKVVVTLEQPVQNAKLIVYDMAGRKQNEQVLNGTQLTVTRGLLPDGFYFFSLYDETGKRIANQKVAFVKE